MTDKEAITILRKNEIESMNDFCSAVAIAANRLIECQWYDYIEGSAETQRQVIDHMSSILLDIEYEDGSHSTCKGHGSWNEEKGFHFVPDFQGAYSKNSKIKHWMKIPKFKEND